MGLDDAITGVKRKLIGFPAAKTVAADDSYLHVGRRSFSRRIAEGGGVFVKKTFVRTDEAREAFRAERTAMERLRGAPWVPAWRSCGARWYVRDHFDPERRLDRVLAAADAKTREDLAAAVAGVILDLHCRGVAHRDLHARNVFVTDDGLRVIDFETSVETPPEAATVLAESYDVTGVGLPSPYHTGKMGFDNTTNECSFSAVLSMKFADAFRLYLDRADFDSLKNELRAASLAFATKDGKRHKCRSGRIYCTFSLPRLTVTAEEAQRDAGRRLARFGLTDADLRGRSLLDLGSNVGGMIFEAQKFGPSRCVGVEYDPDKVAVARRVAAMNALGGVVFVRADIDALAPETLRGPFDVVFCLAIEAHVKDKPRLYSLLAASTSRLLLFEGNEGTDAAAAADALRRAGFGKVEILGTCDDDCRAENNVRPILRAVR